MQLKYIGLCKKCLFLAFTCMALLSACAAPVQRLDGSQIQDLDVGIAMLSENIFAQLEAPGDMNERVNAAFAKSDKKLLVMDKMIDASSGQHTALSVLVEKRLRERMSAIRPTVTIASLGVDTPKQVDVLVIGTVLVESSGTKTRATANAPIRINIAVVARTSGLVIAQASTRIKNTGFDTTPDKFEQDSPTVTFDRFIRGYVRTAASAPKQKADPSYLSQIAANTAIGEGTDAYNQNRYADSLVYFQRALGSVFGDQLRALNGSYLANVKLGRIADAEQVFAKIVAIGIEDRNLGVKFLFNPATTDFWSDQKVSGHYDMWISKIAHGIESSGVCVEVVGHTSASGTESFNEKLSLARAVRIRQRLIAEAPSLAPRINTLGMGFKENIVGTGSDDVRDALDRRVSFKFISCADRKTQ